MPQTFEYEENSFTLRASKTAWINASPFGQWVKEMNDKMQGERSSIVRIRSAKGEAKRKNIAIMPIMPIGEASVCARLNLLNPGKTAHPANRRLHFLTRK